MMEHYKIKYKTKINLNKKPNIFIKVNNKAKTKYQFNRKDNKKFVISISLLILLIPKEYKINFKNNKIYCVLFNIYNVHLFKELGLLP